MYWPRLYSHYQVVFPRLPRESSAVAQEYMTALQFLICAVVRSVRVRVADDFFHHCVVVIIAVLVTSVKMAVLVAIGTMAVVIVFGTEVQTAVYGHLQIP